MCPLPLKRRVVYHRHPPLHTHTYTLAHSCTHVHTRTLMHTYTINFVPVVDPNDPTPRQSLPKDLLPRRLTLYIFLIRTRTHCLSPFLTALSPPFLPRPHPPRPQHGFVLWDLVRPRLRKVREGGLLDCTSRTLVYRGILGGIHRALLRSPGSQPPSGLRPTGPTPPSGRVTSSHGTRGRRGKVYVYRRDPSVPRL